MPKRSGGLKGRKKDAMWMLEKILEEIEEATKQEDAPIYCGSIEVDGYVRMSRVEDIIRKHMNGGWIPVEKQIPPAGKRLLAKIKHHKWIADYDADWVPEEEKTVHAEYTEVCEITGGEGGIWQYVHMIDGLNEVYVNPEINLAAAVDEIIAWQPMIEQ